MKNNGTININTDYSNNPLQQINKNILSQQYDSKFINNLNNPEYNNNEEELSTKPNINKEEKNYDQNSLKINARDDSLVIMKKPYNEILKHNDETNSNDIQSLNSGTKLKNSVNQKTIYKILFKADIKNIPMQKIVDY